ncbi:hypothetical protein SUGI_1151910 [Cryptomeria japonica]|uniref:tRNA dimethylallyltransferase 2 n=1 Tax=Cryptomeria japonica TaxID=3369 RepID=UPI0024146C50|nr:tRNA dimethylallyltransferase 2 [Cryptomeria japonica]GLJ53916.1 hypothetical protein SUGI_1151910 [Cryptomeria japonica]
MEGKAKVVVILGATGAGKSRLAIDLAHHFPAEIVNADSMQVYQGLDVLTNKVPDHERKGVPHHLLGTVNPNEEFTSKHFRDRAIQIIDSIISRKRLPIIVGGTNYYIQALVSKYLVDDVIDAGDEDLKISEGPFDSCGYTGRGDNQNKGCSRVVCNESNPFDRLKVIDPVAANRLHPNDIRKINRYLDIYEEKGTPPSKIFQGEKSENWGREASFRYDCCFLWVDASLPVLDKYVEQRVDAMVEDGLLKEVSGFYDPKADYTRGLRQAIGVREFESFFTVSPPDSKLVVLGSEEPTNCRPNADSVNVNVETKTVATTEKTGDCHEIAEVNKNRHKILLDVAIKRMKANTCRLVRQQKRRLNRLRTFYGWKLHQLDVTKVLETTGSESLEFWKTMVVDTSINLVKTFLFENANASKEKEKDAVRVDSTYTDEVRDLWTQYVCEYCDRVLRGAHEWKQHNLGRAHRRQVLRLKKKLSEKNVQA